MRRFIGLGLICLLIFSLPATGTPRLGGKGLIYVHSANTLPKGYLELYTGTRYYGEIAGFDQAYTLWNVQGFTSLNYGLSEHLEIGLSPIIYQDTNSDGGNIIDGQANLPDDLYFSLKVGSFQGLESPYVFGGMLYARFPTASEHNILYEPYSAGKVEVGLTAMGSYYSNIVFPEEGWSVHGNLGYLNHNDVGVELAPDAPTANAMTSELLFNVGMLFPMGSFDFSGEIHGRYFLADPPAAANTGGYVSWLTGGVYYKPYPWLTLEMGMDIRLIYEKDQALYPDWRGTLGVKLGILPKSLYQSSEQTLLEKRESERRDVLERMMNDQKDTQDADSELSRIRRERERVEEELRRLRQLLEEEKKKKKG